MRVGKRKNKQSNADHLNKLVIAALISIFMWADSYAQSTSDPFDVNKMIGEVSNRSWVVMDIIGRSHYAPYTIFRLHSTIDSTSGIWSIDRISRETVTIQPTDLEREAEADYKLLSVVNVEQALNANNRKIPNFIDVCFEFEETSPSHSAKTHSAVFRFKHAYQKKAKLKFNIIHGDFTEECGKISRLGQEGEQDTNDSLGSRMRLMYAHGRGTGT